VTTIDVPWSVLPDYRCFGCSPHNATGLRLEFQPHPDGVCTEFRLDRRFESYPGIVHGGLAGVICDETMGNLLVLRRGVSAFTVSMRMRYVAPLLVGRLYTCVARLRENAGGPAELLPAAAEVLDEHGTICATATATYQPFTLEQARQQLALDDHEIETLSAALAAAPNGA
jgi:acyl-coenzyme A thioesterase PaaI-like protein